MRAVALIAGAVALAACGSTENEKRAPNTFREDGFSIEFEYPTQLKELEDVPVAEPVGSREAEQAAIGLSKTDVILVERYDLNRSIGSAELPVAKAELDALLGRTSFETTQERTTTVAGRPALVYEGRVGAPTNARSRLVVIFDGTREYFVNCQYVNERRRIEAACEQALRTMRFAP